MGGFRPDHNDSGHEQSRKLAPSAPGSRRDLRVDGLVFDHHARNSIGVIATKVNHTPSNFRWPHTPFHEALVIRGYFPGPNCNLPENAGVNSAWRERILDEIVFHRRFVCVFDQLLPGAAGDCTILHSEGLCLQNSVRHAG
jgi:hypothetical protein